MTNSDNVTYMPHQEAYCMGKGSRLFFRQSMCVTVTFIFVGGVAAHMYGGHKGEMSVDGLIKAVAGPVLFVCCVHKLSKAFQRFAFFGSHYMPIIEEVGKLGLLALFFSSDSFNWYEFVAFNFVISFASSISYLNFAFGRTLNEFWKYYSLFLDHEKTLDSKLTPKEDSLFPVARTSMDLMLKRASINTNTSGETLVNKMSIRITTPSTSCAHDAHSDNICGEDRTEAVNQRYEIAVPAMKASKSDLVDKLYSVSPGNTYHLDPVTAEALQSNNAVQEDHSNNYYGALDDCDAFHEVDETYENIDEEEVSSSNTHLGGGGGGNFKYVPPSGGKLRFGGGAGFDFSHSDNESDESQKISHYRKYLGWLVPHKRSQKRLRKLRVNSHAQYLEQRLSSYTLNSDVDVMLPKALSELHLQKTVISPGCKGRYEGFENFLRNYFDTSTNGVGFNVDYFFKNYGVLTAEIPFFFLILDQTSYISWVIISNLFLFICFHIGYFWPLLFAFLLVIKLFELNFLSWSLSNYKLVIVSKSFINFIILLVFLPLIWYNHKASLEV